MKIFAPLALIAALSVLPFVGGCQTMGSTATVEIPTVESPQDSALSKSVRDRLLADKKLDLTGITVVSKSGTVYLSGLVKSLDARQQAIKIAWDVPGVQSVVNSLDVQR
ncbi:MAG: BON domain-containing protein [Candidatus Binatia bacterium]